MRYYPYAKQHITDSDIEAVTSILRSPFLTQGPTIELFEKKICRQVGAKYAVAVANGTAALHLACLAAGITTGDEGITSPMTFVASANCITYCGGTVKLADINFQTGLIDPDQIRKKITKKTHVIIPVHYAGQSCDMEKIQALVKGKRIAIIEDAAHAIGSEYKGTKIGSCKYSDMTTFSFHPVKTITTGEGGAIMTNSAALYERLVILRTHGITKDASKFTGTSHKTEPWYYEMQTLGFNYRLTDIQAALGVSQTKRLTMLGKRRQEIVAYYDRAFENHPFVTPIRYVAYGKSVRHLYVIKITFSKLKKNREYIMSALRKQGVGTQVHYIPIHYQPYYVKRLGYNKGDFPNAEAFYEQCLSIPLYSSLTDADIRYIAKTIADIVSS